MVFTRGLNAKNMRISGYAINTGEAGIGIGTLRVIGNRYKIGVLMAY